MKVADYEIPEPVLVKAARWLKRRSGGEIDKDDLIRFLYSVAMKTHDGSLRARTYRLAGALIQAWKRKGLVAKVSRTRKWQVVQ